MKSLSDNPKLIRTILFAASITTFLIVIQLFYNNVGTLLRYESSLATNNEWWRLITGHFIHLSWAHLFLNIAGIWLLVFLFHQAIKPVFVISSAIILAISISLLLLTFNPEISRYVGLSGVLHGFLILGALATIQTSPGSSIILLIGISLKLAWEQLFADPNAMYSLIGGSVVYDAHLYGAISGVLIFTAYNIKNYFRKSEK